jgi:hypothetical protein
MANVKITVRLRREAGVDALLLSGPKIVRDYVANKIGGSRSVSRRRHGLTDSSESRRGFQPRDSSAKRLEAASTLKTGSKGVGVQKSVCELSYALGMI